MSCLLRNIAAVIQDSHDMGQAEPCRLQCQRQKEVQDGKISKTQWAQSSQEEKKRDKEIVWILT